MRLAISTHWNAGRHDSGEAMIDELLALGFTQIELGYNLRAYHVPGVRARVASGAVRVTSLHSFCPVPADADVGHPELWTLADPTEAIRRQAIKHLGDTLRFAGEVGAKTVVAHAGNVRMRAYTRRLEKLGRNGQRFTDKYERIKLKAFVKRERKVDRQFDHLCRGIEQLLPILTASGVRLAFEILPTWEAIPTEPEVPRLFSRFDTAHLCYWHDLGHGQIRELLGLSNHYNSLAANRQWLGGMHVHDVRPPYQDHAMPPGGQVDFARFRTLLVDHLPLVLEPGGELPGERVRRGAETIEQAWWG